METSALSRARPILAVILMQCSYAAMSIVAKFALNQGMSPHVLVAYRMAVAAVLIAPFVIVFERRTRPKMTVSIFAKIFLLGLFEPVMDQNLYYTGMKHTTATFISAMCNILPAMTFVLACLCRLEKVKIKRVHSQAKVMGTLVAVGGAMLMTLLKGPAIKVPWTGVTILHHQQSPADVTKQDLIKGAAMIVAGCFSWSCFIILQAITLKSYPAELSLTCLVCLIGSVQCTVLTLVLERKDPEVWLIHFDVKFFAVVYGGLVSGMAYYIMGWVMRRRGPVFVSSFNPLNMVIVAILSSFILSEQMRLGRVLGAGVIVVGLYLVLWGKSKDEAFSIPDIEGLPETHQEMAAATNDSTINVSTNPDMVNAEVNPLQQPACRTSQY